MAVGATLTGWPVAPLAGVVLRPSAGWYRRRSPTAGQLGVGPVGVVVVDVVAAVGDEQLEGGLAGHVALTVAVGLAPVRTPESYTLVPSAKTWKTTEPLLATSSSSADLGRERRAAAHRVADVRRGMGAQTLRVDDPGEGQRQAVTGAPARRCCDPSRPVPSRWRSRYTPGPTGTTSCRRRLPS